MKVTKSDLTAITCILNEIIESDSANDQEISLTIKFLKTFRLPDDKLQKLVDEACNMNFDDAAAVVKNMDDATKQEFANIISDVMFADGVVSDEEAVKFMTLIADCEMPMPDTKEWVDWCKSAGDSDDDTILCNDVIDDLSGEDSEICFFVIRAGGPHYGGKCRTIVNKKYEYGIDDSQVAKTLLGCKEHVLYDCGEAEILDMLTREMGFDGYGKFHGYICEKPYDSSDNRAASDIFGQKISGHCLIRFVSDEGEYLEMNKAQCAKMFELLKQSLTCKMLHRTEDLWHCHNSGPSVLMLSRQDIETRRSMEIEESIEVESEMPIRQEPERPLTDDEKIQRWLDTFRPEDNGYELEVDYKQIWSEMDTELWMLDDDAFVDAPFSFEPVNTVKELILYVIEHDDEQPYYNLLALSFGYRMAQELKLAAYWAHKAVLLGKDGLDYEGLENFGITGVFIAYEELGNCYFSVEPCFEKDPKFPDFKKAAEYYEETHFEVSEIMCGRSYLGLGDYAKAEKSLTRYNSSSILAWRGHFYKITHQTDKAEKCWEESIKGNSGWGEYFMGRYLWNEEFYDCAIRLWQQGEAKGCTECTGELFNWIFGHPQSRYETKDEYWRKLESLHAENKCVSGYKYKYKYIANDSIQMNETVLADGSVCSNDFCKDVTLGKALHDGIRRFCPYCLKLSRDTYRRYTDSQFQAILRAWGYNEQEASWSTR